MAVDIKVPPVGESISEGTISRGSSPTALGFKRMNPFSKSKPTRPRPK